MFGPLLVPVVAIGGLAVLGVTIFVTLRLSKRAGALAPPRFLGTLCAVCVAISVLLCVAWAARTSAFSARAQSSRETSRQQRALVYGTDHRAVLLAARQMLRDTNGFKSTGWVPEANLPKALLHLDPSYVAITEDRSAVHIEIGGAAFHFGLEAYAEGRKGGGTKELMPGLWYYSEDQKVPPGTVR